MSTGARGLLHRLTHVGVDPALPRRDTKHIVLLNAFALFNILSSVLTVAISPWSAIRPDVTLVLAIGGVVAATCVALNAARQPISAGVLMMVGNLVGFGYIGSHEPPETEHAGFLIVGAVVSFFAFPPTHRYLSAISTVLAAGVILWLTEYAYAHPVPQLPGYDAHGVATANIVILLNLLVFFAWRAASEIERVERDLVEERKKTEALLKREVAHQVAERSRELGSALAQGSGVASPSLSGARFGSRYEVLRPLGEGGMGAVVEVKRVTDGAHLALKVMTGAVSREQAARFAREAEIGARVHHEHLISIVDVGMAEGGAPYLVMELATGGSLEGQRARFGDVPWALSMLRQMAAGLVALHEAGVVHRDLKPANVLLDEKGTAKLSDFGIARMGAIPMGAVDPDAPTEAPAPGAKGSALTGTGAWIGTPLYMAPEAARGGREVGPAVDVFAFGLVAHELLTGKLPFTTPPVLLALVGQPLPALAKLDLSGLDPKVRDVITSCLAETPSARPTASALRQALGA